VTTTTEDKLKWSIVTIWVLYGLTFFPFQFPKEYLVQWAFVFIAFLSIVGISATVFRRSKTWRIASTAAAVALLLTYGEYWLSLTTTAREMQPTLASPIALGYIFEQAMQIAIHLWGRGARLGALQAIYFELVMPIVQMLLLVWIIVGAYQAPRSNEVTKGNGR
jgi:hypothetical protein